MSSASTEYGTAIKEGEKNAVVLKDKKENAKNYKGFFAGIFSGVTKLAGKLFIISLFLNPALPNASFKPKWSLVTYLCIT